MSLTTVSLDLYLADPTSEAALQECKKAAEGFIATGALVVQDSRASADANNAFLDLLEDYFDQPDEVLKKDERPEVGYQVGVTLENTEKPKCASDTDCKAIIASLDPAERPLDLGQHGADPKCRFFHRMSTSPPYKSAFPTLSEPNVIPPAFADIWEDRMNEWGKCMKQAAEGIAEMVSIGLGLEKNHLNEAGAYGSHLLAPTATDLRKFGKMDSIFAGYHSDLNAISVHGAGRYPGLNIWARNTGKRIGVKVPPGCLLMQAGKQLEWETGGLIKAGYHEVVCNERTLEAIERCKRERPGRPLIRISSTFFWHLSADHKLVPVPALATEAEKRFGPQDNYGSMLVGDQVRRELGLIALMATE